MICAFAVATFSRFLPCSGCAFDKSNASPLSPKQSKLKQESESESEQGRQGWAGLNLKHNSLWSSKLKFSMLQAVVLYSKGKGGVAGTDT